MNINTAIAALNELKGYTIVNRPAGVIGKIYDIHLSSYSDAITIVCKVNRNDLEEDIRYWTQDITISFLKSINEPAELFKIIFRDNKIFETPLFKLTGYGS